MRSFWSKWLRKVVTSTAALLFVSAAITAQNFVDVKPSPQQVAWQDLEFGVIIHFGLNTFQDREWGDGTTPPLVFNPSEFNPEQWMRAIKAAGGKYVIFDAVVGLRGGCTPFSLFYFPFSLCTIPLLS